MIISYALQTASRLADIGASYFACTFLIIIAFALALMLSLSSHEMSHAYAAKINGDNTAKLCGRLTLNPFKHFDLFGTCMMLLVGFGWAKPVPINPDNFTKYKKGMFQVAVAGVTTNLLSAFIQSLLVCLLLLIPIPATTSFWFYIYLTVLYFLQLSVLFNLNFFFFNLLPLFPLDGYRVLEAFLPPTNRLMIFLRRYSSFILMGLILLGFISSRFGLDVSPLTLYISTLNQLFTKWFYGLWGLVGLPTP